MPKTWWGRAIFWVVLFSVIPAIFRALSGQTQRTNEAKLIQNLYHSCMDAAEREYADANSSNNPEKRASFAEKYGVEKHQENKRWSGVIYYADKHCSYVSRKKHAASSPSQ